MDFSLVSKHQKDLEQRRRDAKRKLDEQKKEAQFKSDVEANLEQRETERLQTEALRRQRSEEEALMNDGVRWHAQLKVWPSDRTDDKLVLPPSALQRLSEQGALESGMLSFAVALPGEVSGTHAGVAEFVAEEGTIGIPPRVALCLTKGAGLNTLESIGTVQVRFVRLPRSSQCTARLQPRGHGFHVDGIKAIRMDLQHVLMESLRGHVALTVGDWLPIRHAGVSYELVVKELSPDPQLSLIDTELSIDIMPSEVTEAEHQAEEERKVREVAEAKTAEERELARLARAKEKAAALVDEPPAGPDVVQLMLKLPEGARLQRRFLRSTCVSEVLNWVESEPDTLVSGPSSFRLVQKWPGYMRELGIEEAQQTLADVKFGRQEALFLQRLSSEEVAAETEGVNDEPAPSGMVPIVLPPRHALRPLPLKGSNDITTWKTAEERAHESLDRRVDGTELPTPTAAVRDEPSFESVHGQDLVDVFERLKALGMAAPAAAVASKRFAAQLRELGEMGFEDWIAAVPLLEKYNGRLLRVANLLSEQADNVGMLQQSSPAPATEPAPTAASAASAPKLGAGLPKELVAAEFKKLVAGGMAPNDAALKAIEIVASVSEQRTAPSGSAENVSGESVVSESYEAQLRELASMGFTDVEKNRALLKKYAGRIERVIDAHLNVA